MQRAPGPPSTPQSQHRFSRVHDPICPSESLQAVTSPTPPSFLHVFPGTGLTVPLPAVDTRSAPDPGSPKRTDLAGGRGGGSVAPGGRAPRGVPRTVKVPRQAGTGLGRKRARYPRQTSVGES
ncbi:hypothetical protein H8959_005203 [Pygathrix nigripes]